MDEILNIEHVRKCLYGVFEIIRNVEQELDKDGSRFNIFSILNLSSNEVRLHSNFIAVLLNPKGTHTYKTEFLEIFINKLRTITDHKALESFDKYSCTVEVEKFTGFINDTLTSGGRIDIILTDKLKNRIIIENKIFAADQENQLLRYYNFDDMALLLYLTLEGNQPSPHSLGSTEIKLVNKEDFFCISYREFILEWLKECAVKAREKPKVSETISQYINILKEFTHQSHKHNMSREIEKLILSNREFYNSIDEIISSYNSFRQSIEKRFWENLEAKKHNHSTIITLPNNAELRYYIDDDPAGFFFGFYIFRNGNRADCLAEEFKPLVEIFKAITNEFRNNHSEIGWIFSKEFRGFGREKERIFDLKDENEMDKLIDQIINEINGLICLIEDGIKNSRKVNLIS